MQDNFFGFSQEIIELDQKISQKCKMTFEKIDEIQNINQQKVLKAFNDCRISATHFMGSTGYGYGDIGRDKLDELFAKISGAEAALFRAQFMSGTHAITVALFGVLRPGQTMLSVAGVPYDTLQGVIGIGDSDKNGFGTLKEFGINYKQIELKGDEIDFDALEQHAKNADVIYIQRSRGYTNRRALGMDDIKAVSDVAKSANKDAIVVVDNCYGEFCDTKEPTECGADLMIGSLLKNPGGGIAETGGYIAGKKQLVELCARRLTTPSVGGEIGSWPMGLRNLYLGLYMAPVVTAEALKSSVYASALFEELGFVAYPSYSSPRNDIITSVDMGSAKKLEQLCFAIQSTSPIDSFAVPVGSDMPGYDSKVIMAAGAFTNGSSIELSCDGPMKPPYTAFMQGGLSLGYSKISYLTAAELLNNR